MQQHCSGCRASMLHIVAAQVDIQCKAANVMRVGLHHGSCSLRLLPLCIKACSGQSIKALPAVQRPTDTGPATHSTTATWQVCAFTPVAAGAVSSRTQKTPSKRQQSIPVANQQHHKVVADAPPFQPPWPLRWSKATCRPDGHAHHHIHPDTQGNALQNRITPFSDASRTVLCCTCTSPPACTGSLTRSLSNHADNNPRGISKPTHPINFSFYTISTCATILIMTLTCRPGVHTLKPH